jgi:glycosyltransferase involved in cell wall biosynthesis
MERLKVLFISTCYPTKEHPVDGVFVREHAKAVHLYDDVRVLHCAGPDPYIRRLWRMERERDESLTGGIPTYRVWYRSLSFPKIWYFFYILSVLQGFRHIVSEGFRPHIIHAHFYEAGVPAVLIGKFYRIPVVMTEHDSRFQRKIIRGFKKLKAKFVFNNADLVTPVSKSLQKAIEEYGIKTHFKVIPNAVDISIFNPLLVSQPKNHLKRLLFVGLLDLSHNKGMSYLLNALALLLGHRDDWHLDIVGDGPGRAACESLSLELKLSDKITFHGLKTKEEIAGFMRQAHVFILPSLSETFSVVAAEALAVGTPVLATRCGGPEEFITDEVGQLVPPKDAKALYQGLNFMLDNFQLGSREKIHQYAKRLFSLRIVGAKFHEAYQSLKFSN